MLYTNMLEAWYHPLQGRLYIQERTTGHKTGPERNFLPETLSTMLLLWNSSIVKFYNENISRAGYRP